MLSLYVAHFADVRVNVGDTEKLRIPLWGGREILTVQKIQFLTRAPQLACAQSTKKESKAGHHYMGRGRGHQVLC